MAFSGGLDSQVLLHRLAGDSVLRCRYRLQAVHVDHQLQAASGRWADQCAALCQVWAIPCRILRVVARPEPGESPEAVARRARYGALQPLIDRDTALVTAHQRSDQAETVLLALLRGSGPRGLAAMAALARFGDGWLWRPLLTSSRTRILEYGRRYGLEWIEDPSNADTGFDRNFLRHRVLPPLRQRWPATDRALAQVAEHCAESLELLDALAGEDLRAAAVGDALSIGVLRALSPARCRNLVRFWLRRHGLPVPGRTIVGQLLTTVLAAGADRQPLLQWRGGELRRHRDRLYAMAPLPPVPQAGRCVRWSDETELDLPDGGRLRRVAAEGPGLPPALEGLTVCYRRGGERFHPWGRRHSQALKKLLQEAGMPPWERERVPLIYWHKRLVAVPGLGVDNELAHSPGWRPQWQKNTGSATL